MRFRDDRFSIITWTLAPVAGSQPVSAVRRRSSGRLSRRIGGLVLLLNGAGTPAATPLDGFEAALNAQASATAALGQWCVANRLSSDPMIRARPVNGRPIPPPRDLRRLLELGPDEPLGYRHVQLLCGGKVLSEAHNWYARDRLTPAMNRALDRTDTPFGRITAPLGFTRQRLSSIRGSGFACSLGTVLSHRSRLVLPDGKPLAYLVECYKKANLDRPEVS